MLLKTRGDTQYPRDQVFGYGMHTGRCLLCKSSSCSSIFTKHANFVPLGAVRMKTTNSNRPSKQIFPGMDRILVFPGKRGNMRRFFTFDETGVSEGAQSGGSGPKTYTGLGGNSTHLLCMPMDGSAFFFFPPPSNKTPCKRSSPPLACGPCGTTSACPVRLMWKPSSMTQHRGYLLLAWYLLHGCSCVIHRVVASSLLKFPHLSMHVMLSFCIFRFYMADKTDKHEGSYLGAVGNTHDLHEDFYIKWRMNWTT